MLRKIALPILLTAVMASTACAADWWLVPYGSFNIYSDHSSGHEMTIQNPAIEEIGISVSQVEDGVGGGLTIGADFESIGGIFGFNIEYLTTSTDMILDEFDPLLGPSELHIDSPAMSFGGFFAGEIPFFTSDTFRGYGGLELGVLQTSGTANVNYTEEVVNFDDDGNSFFTYEPREESVDLGQMSMYMSIFLTEEFMVLNRFGLSGTLGYRGMTSSLKSISSESINGKYGQDFTGLFVRVGVKIDI